MSWLRKLNRRYLLRYRLEYALVLLCAYAVRSLSPAFAWRTARTGARLLFRLGMRRRVLLANLEVAFPGWTEEQRRRLARRSLEHFASMVVDVVFQRRMVSRRRLDRNFVLTGWVKEYMDHYGPEGYRRRSQRILYCTPHLGNWELASSFFSLFGIRVAPVYRGTNNPFLDRLIRRLRLDQRFDVIERRGAVQEMLERFDRGENVGILCDQSALRGIYVPFFGVETCTHKTPAVLVRDHGVDIVFGVFFRRGDFLRYELRARKLEFDPPTDDRQADLTRILTGLLRLVEEQVRQEPEQYFWLHHRFKRSRGLRSPAPGRSQKVGAP
ncbi:MAG: lysophospholipid acyltransferase family protein [Planctomycetota bacterium]